MSRVVTIQSQAGENLPITWRAIDEVGANERAEFFTKRSIKKKSKLDALYAAIEMCDLTTLEGADTPGRVHQMCMKAIHPAPPALFSEFSKHPLYRPIPSVAAVCVYPSMVPVAVKALAGTKIQVASVATGFPAGQVPFEARALDTRMAIEMGASEIDMVISRGAFLGGNYQQVFDEIAAIKEICGRGAHLKVILETGELGSYDRVRLASDIAMEAGADFIKTSTGKVTPAATMPVTLIMLQAIADYYKRTGRMVGMKPAGGIRTAKQAVHYLVMVSETVGPKWLTPKMFRFGASALLNDLLKQIYKELSGTYYYDKAFSLD